MDSHTDTISTQKLNAPPKLKPAHSTLLPSGWKAPISASGMRSASYSNLNFDFKPRNKSNGRNGPEHVEDDVVISFNKHQNKSLTSNSSKNKTLADKDRFGKKRDTEGRRTRDNSSPSAKEEREFSSNHSKASNERLVPPYERFSHRKDLPNGTVKKNEFQRSKVNTSRQGQSVSDDSSIDEDPYQMAHFKSTMPTHLPPRRNITLEPHLERNSIILRPKMQAADERSGCFKRKKKAKYPDLRLIALIGTENQKSKIRRPFKPTDNIRILWELLVLIVVMIDMIILPLDISFGIFLQTRPFAYVSTAVLWTDILVNFHTAYYRHGVLVEKHSKIARHYLRTWLIPDIIVAFPYWTISMAVDLEDYDPGRPYLLIQLVRLVKLVKLVRVLKSFKLSMFLKKYKISSVKLRYLDGFLRLWNLIFISILIAHWVGCIWHYIGAVELYNGHETNWLNDQGIADSSTATQYSYSFYWAITTVMTVGYGDVTPVTVAEVWFAAFSMFLGCGLFAYFISSIGSIVAEMRKNKVEVNARIYEVDRFLHENKISKPTQGLVKTYMKFMYEEEYYKKNNQLRILSEVPKSLRKQILMELNSNILMSNIVFAANFSSNFVKDLSLFLKEQIACPGDIVDNGRIKSNEENRFYILAKGRIELVFRSAKKPLKTLTLGKYFGDVTFFSNKETKIEARCLTYCRIFSISKKEFLEVLADHSDERESYCLIQDKINLYNDHSDLRTKCFVCGLEDHNVIGCASLNVVLKSEEIIGIAKKSDLHSRRSFIRKGRRTHFQVIDPNSHAYQRFEDKHNQCSLNPITRRNSLNYLCDLQYFEEDDESSIEELKFETQINKEYKVFYNRWGSKSLTSIPESTLEVKKCLCQRCRDRRSFTQNMNVELCNIGHTPAYSFHDRDIRSTEVITFDRVKIWEKYFPHNNIDNVAHFINHANEDKIMRLTVDPAVGGTIYNSIKKPKPHSRFLNVFRKKKASLDQEE